MDGFAGIPGNCFVFISVLFCQGVFPEILKPRLSFVLEPPSRVDFYNTTGTVIPCVATGDPKPSLYWTTREGVKVQEIPGLRHVRPDGSLVFPPFRPKDYRQDVHTAVYRCVASNSFGQIGSRDVVVRGLPKQQYKIQVFDEFTLLHNTAVLRCNIPYFVKDFVSVSSWMREDSSVAIVSSAAEGGRYSVFPTGELHIRKVTAEDAFRTYRCLTKNRLTGEVTPSASAGKLIVTDAHSTVPPRITHVQARLTIERGLVAELPCAAQGYPPPSYKWYRLDENMKVGLISLRVSGSRVFQVEGSLIMRDARVQDSGKYVCLVNNTGGEERSQTELVVKDSLSVEIHPSYQTLDVGSTAVFVCNVSGYPVHGIRWTKDQRPLVSGGRIRMPSRESMQILSVQREDKGFYQCFANNDKDTAQGISQLNLGEESPILKHFFEEMTLEPGSSLSLKCVAVGNPLPQVTWSLDDAPIPDNLKFSVGDYVTAAGEVVSYVNVSSVRPEDGGRYACHAGNDVATVGHSAKINVVGPPFVRPIRDKTAVENKMLTVYCPVAGYPIEDIYWEHNGRRIPYTHRQHAYPNGTLIIDAIDRRSDGGEYTCYARNAQGQTANQSFRINVLSPPIIEAFNFPAVLEEGSRSKILCSVTKGDPPISIRWLKDGRPLAPDLGVISAVLDEYSSTLTFPKISLKHRGNYTCEASNMAATTNYTVTMVIHAPPRWTVEPTNTIAIVGTDTALHCQAEGFPKPRISWSKSSGSLSSEYHPVRLDSRIDIHDNGSLEIRHVDTSDTGFYMCQASNGIGSGLSTVAELVVRVPAGFKEEFRAETVRRGQPLQISCHAYGDRPLSIVWKKDGQLFDVQTDKRYNIKEMLTDDGMTSQLHAESVDRRDSSLFTCLARNAYGQDETNIQIIVQERPDAPNKVGILKTESRSVVIGWSPPYSGNSPISRYILEYKATADNWERDAKQKMVPGTDTRVMISSLLPATSYQFRLTAENIFGKSDPSVVVSAITDMEVPGGPPTDVRTESVGSRIIRVQWQPPAEHLRHGQLKGYYVGYKVHGSSEPYTYKTLEVSEQLPHECVLTNLERLTKYSIVVQAFNSKGAGPPSNEVYVKTLANDPPVSPKLSVLSSTHSSVQLKWELPESNTATGYVLHHKRELGGWEEAQVPGSTQSYTFHDLHCGSKYQFYLTAFNEVGSGLPSETVTVKTQGRAPIAPTQHNFLHVNKTFVSLHLQSWEDGGCPINFFVAQYKPDITREWIPIEERLIAQESPYLIRNLVPGTWYRLHVTAHNDAGSTEAEYSFSTLTEAGPPVSSITEERQPFYTNVVVVLPVVATSIVVAVVFAMVCAIIRKRRIREQQYMETRNQRKTTNNEAVQMSELDSKQNSESLYVQSKEPLYFPSPYATSKIPVFVREERSNVDGGADGRSVSGLQEERAYDVPFMVNKQSNMSHSGLSRSMSRSTGQDQHLYSFPMRPSSQSGLMYKEHQDASRSWMSESEEDASAFHSNSPRRKSAGIPRWPEGTKFCMPPVKASGEGYRFLSDEEDRFPLDSWECGDPPAPPECSDTECDRDQLLEGELAFGHDGKGLFMSREDSYPNLFFIHHSEYGESPVMYLKV